MDLDLSDRKNWLGWRQKGIGSSDAAIIWGDSPYKNRYDLFLDKTMPQTYDGEAKEENGYITFRGQELEPLIRKRWATIAAMDLNIESEWLPLNVDQGGKVMRASLDGVSDTTADKVIAEFKFQGKDAHKQVERGIIAGHYRIQIQHQLLVSGAKRGFLVSYNPELDTILYHEVLADVEFHNEHIRKCKSFWKEVLDKTPSGETLSFKKDIRKNDDAKAKILAQKYAVKSAELKMLEHEVEVLKKELIAANGNADKTDFEFVTVTKATRAGSVEYKNIPEVKALKPEYLDTFKKPDTEYFLVKVK